MPIFDTAAPITVELSLISANIRINATDRIDTAVEVRPSTESSKKDVALADLTEVRFSNGTLVVKTPKPKPLLGGRGSIDVVIDLPAGSRLRGDSAVADLRATGLLGECRFSIASGDLEFNQTGPLNLNTTSGRISVEHTTGHADITTGSGEVWLHQIDGTAVIRNSNGPTTIGDITGDLRVKVANGDTTIHRAQSTVAVKSAAGNIRLNEVVRGSVVLDTNVGDLEVGIRQGTAAHLDVSALTGRLINELATTGGPETNDEIVKIQARTLAGNIRVHRTQPQTV
ncbi:DUF4097 family beta strand repeat-containing protein [Crossiella sp. CA198]|uniref:DUF4097 family beta strand repeat-containing protein n=1 Tax=Crossiella sp. CA198 TaxID=3455607 RepID=UPI003F8D5C00